MALEKEYFVDNIGLDIKYWKIGRINVDIITETVEITMYGWRTKEDRIARRPPVYKKKIVLDNGDYASLLKRTNIIQETYNLIKNRKIELEGIVVMDFTGSSDV